MTVYVIAVLWISVFTQIIVNQFFSSSDRMIDAFADTNSNIIQSEIKVIADYGTKYLSEEDKKSLIDYIAGSINLNTDYAFKTNSSSALKEISVDKPSKNANTKIKILSLDRVENDGSKQVDQYIVVDLNVYENIDSVLTYKKLIENILKELEVVDYQTTILFTGNYDGKLSSEEMNQITDELIGDLQAKTVSENRNDDLFTVYAYSGLIDEYIVISGAKVNVNIAFTYDETNNQTELYLATPVINSDY